MSEYACGCIRNKAVCAAAERLWDAVADAHKAMVHAPESQIAAQDYADALATYEAHFAAPLVGQPNLI